MSNKDLLKQAIAEAKTIREAAIANAKEALEETLTPHLKEMLAQKLQEMEEDEDTMEEYGIEHNDRDVDGDGDIDSDDTRLAEEEAEEEEAPEEEAEEETEEVEEEDEDIDPNSPDFGKELKQMIRQIVHQEIGNEEEEIEAGEEAPEGEEDMVSMDGDSEEIDINELLAELEQAELEEGLGKAITGAAKKVVSTVKKWDDAMTGAKPLPGTEKLADKIKAGGDALKKRGYNLGGNLGEELNEALETINVLKNQLQEVNLLNAKLLYVNKVFKANNLSEGQKVNVIAAFDKAETVKEVKLVFETVSKNVVAKPAAIKEHRSFASKATGNAQTTAPKEILSEVSEQVARWQKLAGIK